MRTDHLSGEPWAPTRANGGRALIALHHSFERLTSD